MANSFKLNVSFHPVARSNSMNFQFGNVGKQQCYRKQRQAARIVRPLCCSTEASSSAESSTSKNREVKLLSSLDSYFNKLQNGGSGNSSIDVAESTSSSTVIREPNAESRDLHGLTSLNAYFDKIQVPHTKDVPNEVPKASTEDEEVLSFLKELEENFEKRFPSDPKPVPTDFVPKNATTFTNIMIGLNVAVFLFGLASPVQTPEMVEVPLPLLYGAKINALIADGQWWRLITPMFLHDGLIHIALGAWALVSIGPGVEYVYGPTGFCMIYLLGGIFGNLTSFLHTPAPTVGGTGPLYALIAAWAVYIVQNRHCFSKDMQAGIVADAVQKILVLSALHLALMDALPADNWTHMGATFPGLLFGLLATPKAAQMNVRLEDLDNKVVLSGETPDLQRLSLAFALCMGLFLTIYTLGSPAATELLRALSRNDDPNFL